MAKTILQFFLRHGVYVDLWSEMSRCLCAGCYGVGYSASVVELPSDAAASSGYGGITGMYSSEYIVANAVTNGLEMPQPYHSSVDATSQYHHVSLPAGVDTSSQYHSSVDATSQYHHVSLPAGVDTSSQYHSSVDTSSEATAAMLTYASHYAPPPPMMTTVPYCAPLVADPYIVPHAGVSYPHQVIAVKLLFISRCLCHLVTYSVSPKK